jgi:hypothetical protein
MNDLSVSILDVRETVYDTSIEYTVQVSVSGGIADGPEGAHFRVSVGPGTNPSRQTVPETGGSVTFTGQIDNVTEENARINVGVSAVGRFGNHLYTVSTQSLSLGYVDPPASVDLSVNEWYQDDVGLWWDATIHTHSLQGSATEVCAFPYTSCNATVWAVTDSGEVVRLAGDIGVGRRGHNDKTVGNIGGTAAPAGNYVEAYVVIAGSLAYGVPASITSARVPIQQPYVDPIPPPPPGHEIVDGYDVDEIAAAIDAAGGLSVLAVMVNTIPGTNSNGGSTNDLAEAVLVAQKSGMSTKRVVQLLVDTAGAGVLIYLVAAFIRPGGSQKEDPRPPAPQPPRSNPSTGGNSGGSSIELNPGDSTVNEVLRSWYRRIDEGKLGNSQVAQDVAKVLPEESLREVARQCLKDVAAAARAGATFATTNPCRDMRILVPAGDGSGAVILDAYEAALHDRDAISLRPEWAQLNYMSSAAKKPQVARDWFRVTPYSAISKCKDKDIALACDEYPLYSTTQGGPVEFGGTGASLRPVSRLHNTTEGSVFGAMVSTSACEMKSAPSVSQGVPATGGTPFLVVPMPGHAIPSFFLC